MDRLISMHVTHLPEITQDYLKTVWDICERTGAPAALGKIAEQMGQKTSTTSEAIKRLTERGLLVHPKYGGISLTPEGNAFAMAMVRRHRLVEMFLYTTLGYTWDEVHDEADLHEHAISDTLLARIDAHLGHPTRDPHGDPIPDVHGSIETVAELDLSQIEPGQTVTVDRIHDRDPELLRYLAEHNIGPGVRITVSTDNFPGMRVVHVNGNGASVPLAHSSLWAINVHA